MSTGKAGSISWRWQGTHRSSWIVIPAFNEARTIGSIVDACHKFADGTIVVDDGSCDSTAEISAAHKAVVLRNPGNLGKGASLWRGMEAALARGADRVVTLDGDGQHRPEHAVELLACSQELPDRIVIGSRKASSTAAPRARFIANRVADFWVSWAARHPVEDSQSGFRVYPAEVLRALAGRPPRSKGFAFESEILIRAGELGVRTVSVAIPTIYGKELRESHFRPVMDITRIVLLVGAKLLARWMDPFGLWRSLQDRRSASRRVNRR
ncbi:MAG: glycosyltransferase family 2 protein [Acetobacteraceae bacterium]|nr:glycosyltransferase family 2 protein [Acetobacteraceae bacterium]